MEEASLRCEEQYIKLPLNPKAFKNTSTERSTASFHVYYMYL